MKKSIAEVAADIDIRETGTDTVTLDPIAVKKLSGGDAVLGVDADVPVPDLGLPEPSGEIPEVMTAAVIDTSAPRPKRSRKKKEQAPAQPAAEVVAPVQMSAEQHVALQRAIGMGARTVFLLIASQRGAHWRLTSDEEKELGEVWGVALAPFLATSGKYVPLAVAALATAGTVMPRIQQDAELAKAAEANNPLIPEPSKL